MTKYEYEHILTDAHYSESRGKRLNNLRLIKFIYMEISNEKFGMLLKEAASEAGRRRGISVAHILIDEGVVGSTSALS